VAAAAAALVVVGLIAWAIASRSDPEPPARERTPVVWFEDTLERAMQPLEREYDALRVDVDAVADVVWRGMPQPLLRLFGE
jgi:hypothetical protein